jgi:hypothetical protein
VDWRQKLMACQYDSLVKKILSFGILALGLASCNIVTLPSLSIANLTVDAETCKTIPATPAEGKKLALTFNYVGTLQSLTVTLSYKSGSSPKVQRLEIPEFKIGGTLPDGVTSASSGLGSNTIKLNIDLEKISTTVTPSAVVPTPTPTNPVLPPDDVVSKPMDFKIEAKDPDGKASVPSLLEQKAINVAPCFTPKP